MFSIRNHVVIFFFGFDKYAQNQIRPIYILCHIYIVYYSLRSSIQNYKNCTRNKTQRIKKQYKSNFLLFDLYKYFLYQFNFLYLFILCINICSHKISRYSVEYISRNYDTSQDLKIYVFWVFSIFLKKSIRIEQNILNIYMYCAACRKFISKFKKCTLQC